MTQITLEGSMFYIAGGFSAGSQRELRARLIEGGATMSDSISKRLDGFIAGRSCRSKYNRALSRGIPILNEAHLLALLEYGEVEVIPEPVFENTFDIDVAISEVRGLFDGVPTSTTWTRLLEVLEQADATHQDVLLNYIAPVLNRWATRADLPMYSPPRKHELTAGVYYNAWVEGFLQRELFIAPPLWLMEMLRGEYHPKHALARLVNLNGFRVNGSQLQNVLKNPYLTQVHTLVIGKHCRPSKAMLEVMVTAPMMVTVEHLYIKLSYPAGFDYLSDAWTQHKDDHTLLNLKHLYAPSFFKEYKCFEGIQVHEYYFF